MEIPLDFKNGNETLRGVLHEPALPNGAGLVFLHGWSGDRLGPHRMFVTLARRLEAEGYAVLRFDFRGRGDSDGALESASIRGMIADARCAADALLARPGVRRLFLLGICSGGKVAIGAAAGDPRVQGLVLWSAEAMGRLRVKAARANRSAHALRAYLRKLASPESWRKILTLRVNTRMVRKAILTDETPADTERAHENLLLDAFAKFRGPLQFIFGGNDPDTRFAAEGYARFCKGRGIPGSFHEIAGANHSFYSLKWEQEVLDLTERWLREHAGGAPSP